jgi:hypothetical protein
MALLIRGKTICPLCGNLIAENDDVYATPAFLKPTHPLASYSDAAFHSQCFAATAERPDVERLLERYKSVMANAPESLEDYEVWIHDALQEFE